MLYSTILETLNTQVFQYFGLFSFGVLKLDAQSADFSNSTTTWPPKSRWNHSPKPLTEPKKLLFVVVVGTLGSRCLTRQWFSNAHRV